MSTTPRLLPILAVSIGGVLALMALSDAPALPGLLAGSRAQAEVAKGAPKPAPALPPSLGQAHVAPGGTAATPKPPSACMESPADLAKQAGVSPGELQVLQNLSSRRGQLDDREKALDTQIQLLAAAEAKIDAKLAAVNGVKAQIQALLGQAGQQQQADVDRLTVVYQKMKPRDAATVMAALDPKVRLQVAAKMKDSALAAILSQMPTADAKALTEDLAHRADSAKAALAAAEQPAAPAPTAAAQSADPLAPARPAAAPRRAKPRRLAAAVRRKTPTAAAAAAMATAAAPPSALKPAAAATPVAAPATAAAKPGAPSPKPGPLPAKT